MTSRSIYQLLSWDPTTTPMPHFLGDSGAKVSTTAPCPKVTHHVEPSSPPLLCVQSGDIGFQASDQGKAELSFWGRLGMRIGARITIKLVIRAWRASLG